MGENTFTEIEYIKPMEIEGRSMAIIESELKEMGIVLEGDTAATIKRCIHTSADFDYAQTLAFSEHAIEDARKLIKSGCYIVTDTNMARAGINKKTLEHFGCQVHCFMADADVAAEAKERGVTRAVVSMERAAALDKPVIFAIGNAPTALLELYDMMQSEKYQPAFVIGVPVGFVNVVAAKERIMACDVPYIVNQGRKGGSNIAAAIVNSILYSLYREA